MNAVKDSTQPEAGRLLRITELVGRLSAAGAKPCHIRSILRAWSNAAPLEALTRQTRGALPRQVCALLPSLTAQLDQLATLQSEYPAADGSARLLVRLADGQLVESVLLPRAGLCVSTQLGCAVGCLFCMTGKSGLLRQLGSAEIVAQVALARRFRPVRRVVFMGMGEPAHNLDNVLEAIDLLGNEGGFGHKQLVFSTVGDPRVFERLPQQRVKPALAISLHTTRHELRRRLLPRAPDIAPADLVALAEQYARAVGHPIQFQWTLLAGINDTTEEMEAVIHLLRGKYAMLNVIPYNSGEGDGWQRPDGERLVQLVRQLKAGGVLTRVRNSAGQEVDGGCGQLRARAEAASRTQRLTVGSGRSTVTLV
ncbi:MAG: RNA methyltransferase [Spongiibacteraceae bacterium]|nr:RNA methyltransferase [Spongiibacteraceae bacterium]